MHLQGAKNAKMVLWQIQNDIIECLSEFVRSKIKDWIPDYYAIIGDEVTDRFSNKEILPLSLRYVRFCANEKPYQVYDGTSAMSSESSGAISIIKREQPLAEYTHCRNHVLNLAISYVCKIQSIKKFMDNLTSVGNFFENSPKRQKYLECFLESY